jgi:hypothetical protein
MENNLRQLSINRKKVLSLKEMEKTFQKSLEQTPQYVNLQQLKDKIKALQTAIGYQEDEIKEQAVSEFRSSRDKNTKPYNGIQIKTFKVVRILDERKAKKWAGEHAPGTLSIKKSEMNKIAKALGTLEFVEIYPEWRAQIASDLSMYEDNPDTSTTTRT